MPVVSTPMKKRPSKRGSRVMRAREQIVASSNMAAENYHSSTSRKRLAVFGHECGDLERRRLLAAPGLDFDVDVHQGNGGGCHPGNIRRVRQCARANFEQFFLHLAG